jgi:hypothetical protein
VGEVHRPRDRRLRIGLGERVGDELRPGLEVRLRGRRRVDLLDDPEVEQALLDLLADALDDVVDRVAEGDRADVDSAART